MKQILLPFGADNADVTPVSAAARFASRFDGHVTALFYPRLPDPVIVDPMSGGVVSYEGIDEEVAAQREQAETQFLAMKHALPADLGGRVSVELERLSNWRQVGEESRIFDLTVVARATRSPHWQTLFEMALFEGGRPVMLTPEAWDKPFGDTVVVAWNRSTETARLIGQSLPILCSAKAVHIVELEGWYASGPDGKALQSYLAGHGIKAEQHKSEAPNGPGAKMVEISRDLGADLMLKGAYTQSRLTQLIFGGATRQILDQADIPVIFAH
ncbi:universal stress protein [Nisaea nitritireducens]|uniref:universal stress protein n=1 Tax=Nisaea nitritireducens TaxID=568392 RepID=UPI001865C189|nr:universal stress protein [Nisaea nitritireducens]